MVRCGDRVAGRSSPPADACTAPFLSAQPTVYAITRSSRLKQHRVDALMVAAAAETAVRLRLVVDFASSEHLPSLYPDRRWSNVVWVRHTRAIHHAAVDIDQILKGENAGEIPFCRATTFELVANQKTATAPGWPFESAVSANPAVRLTGRHHYLKERICC